MKTIIYLIFILVFGFSQAFGQLDRSKAPQPGPAPKIQIGDYTKFELANGLKVFVVENHQSVLLLFIHFRSSARRSACGHRKYDFCLNRHRH